MDSFFTSGWVMFGSMFMFTYITLHFIISVLINGGLESYPIPGAA